MMNRELQQRIQSYLDGELSPSQKRETQSLLESDAEAKALYLELGRTKSILVGNETLAPLPVSREFFWSGIQRALVQAEATGPAADRAEWKHWWWRLLAPLGAMALLLLLLPLPLSPQLGGRGQTDLAANGDIEVESDIPQASLITFRSDSDGLTVVWMDTN